MAKNKLFDTLKSKVTQILEFMAKHNYWLVLFYEPLANDIYQLIKSLLFNNS